MAEAQKVTPMQLKAVEYHMEGMTKTAACRAAGFKHPDIECGRVFSNPAVKAEMESRYDAARKRMDIAVDDVIEGLKEALPMAQNSQDIVAVWREIGKIIGAYTQKIEVDVKSQVDHIHSIKQLENLSEAQLMQLAQIEDFTLSPEPEPETDSGEVLEAEYEEVE